MVDGSKPLSPHEARALVDRFLRTPDCLVLTDHLRSRSHDRRFDIFDLRRALETGRVAPDSWDEKRQVWKYKVFGTDVDGDPLTVVVAFEEDLGVIEVITAYG